MTKLEYKYYLSIANVEGSEVEVLEVEFIAAERAAGFYSQLGPGHVATGGFSNGSVVGRVEIVGMEE